MVVNYSPLDAHRMLEHKIEDSETDILVTLDVAALYPQTEKLLASTRLKKLVVGEFAEYALAPGPVKAHHDGAEDAVGGQARRAPSSRSATSSTTTAAIAAHDIGDPSEALAVMQYTGGTTGLPKGAMLTHANLTAACAQYTETTQSQPDPLKDGEERFLVRAAARSTSTRSRSSCCSACGWAAEIVLHTRFDPAAAVKDIVGKKITVFPGVPTMHAALINLPGVETMDLSSLQFCASGGAPLPLAVQQQFEQLTGCRLCEGWGMSETSPTGTFTPAQGREKPGSCGIPLPGIAIKFVDVADPERDVAAGRARRDLHPGPERDEGLLEEAGGDRRSR